jgi:RimJ/RimL family protein N-acetyltransferase
LARADSTEIDGTLVRYLAIDDLIAMRGAAPRPKDLRRIAELEQLRKTKRTPSRSLSGVRLRDVEEADFEFFFEHQMDPVANEMADFPARERDPFMARWAEIVRDETVIAKTVLFHDLVAGHVVSFDRSGLREVGYWIGREYWGKGIATRALAEFLGYEKARPLYARVAVHNLASIRVLQKCGFTVSGEGDGLQVEPIDDVEEVILKLGS